ncbi:hypothetical protein PF002_g27598 [Phytophthora fragariae]|uniref:Uncharacterized protein n=1 Tax=Phytophthora fragariae TaxID=53985 RepID=A0A6A3WAM3_9STRA|nr:hypothetical protein PF002_g27598 [Phytophthora fragariae]
MEELFSPAAPEPEPSMIPVEHKLTEFPEWVQIREGVRKRPQHQCKMRGLGKKQRRRASAHDETVDDEEGEDEEGDEGEEGEEVDGDGGQQ